jgi:hypothetical protein
VLDLSKSTAEAAITCRGFWGGEDKTTMTMLCNYYKRQSNLYNVIITSDVWDHEGATRTQGTITIDGEVVEWYLAEFSQTALGMELFIDGKLVEVATRRAGINRPMNEIFDALAERHCPETSAGRVMADCGDEGGCPVCAARHELAVYEVVGKLRKVGLKVEMARVTDEGKDRCGRRKKPL